MFTRNVVLLGASSDIGTAILQRASQDGAAQILAVSRRPIGEQYTKYCSAGCLSGIDLLDESCLDKLADAVESKFTEPFAVIHCVGDFWVHRPLVETSLFAIRKMLSSHVLTLFGAACRLTPIMIKNGGGRIVAFSCNSVGYNYPDMSPFTASKAAVESFIKCYANEHSEFGISACALALPTIRTSTVLREKPTGDHTNYITPEHLAEIIIGQILTQSNEVNGNVVKLFRHSKSFYHSSYYDRNPRRQISERD
jgi:NAD(P)-dependent dehydrogenase (short-subunit alcohol dehydrogenase family)